MERDFEDSSRTRGLPRPRVAFPSFADWYALAGPWNVIAQAATQSELVTVTEAQVVTCGRARGIAVDPTKPIQSLMSDGQFMGLDAAAYPTKMTRVSRVFAGCTRPYFEAMETVLAPQREQLAAQHRALLERFAAELTAAGYFP